MKPVPWGILMKNFLKRGLTGNSQRFCDDSCQQINSKVCSFCGDQKLSDHVPLVPPTIWVFLLLIGGFHIRFYVSTSWDQSRPCERPSRRLSCLNIITNIKCLQWFLSLPSRYLHQSTWESLILWSNYLEWPANVTYDLEILRVL